MRITIIGAGGVGGYFGARLAQGGCDVGFVARGAHLAAMRQHGLRVESRLGEIHLPKVRVSDDPAALGPADMVFLCVKLWDTESALRRASAILGPDSAIISFQNGVQKDDLLRRIVGEKRVIGGVGYIGSKIGRPGVIRHTGTMQRLVFGEYDGAKSPRVVALTRLASAEALTLKSAATFAARSGRNSSSSWASPPPLQRCAARWAPSSPIQPREPSCSKSCARS